ncbi:hypothetical protein LSH36_96g04019 [Paralvinella palmiformis]|uniref:G-protein coupled receptors family 1 profile domain-containing protein n=1 Tax=Paralvinella palmiformis TaxID=53620 RepID=A0AAD9K1U6_9ANNE|nr:hypothetical protein LSH36_96g04019 [Paralvinella palmiformis]
MLLYCLLSTHLQSGECQFAGQGDHFFMDIIERNFTPYGVHFAFDDVMIERCNCSDRVERLICEILNGTAANVTSSCPDSALLEDDWWDLLALKKGKGQFRKLMDTFNLYLTPVIIILGVVGNFLSFLVFSVSHLRRNSSSVYLAALALVDTGFLLSLLIVWLDKVDVPLFDKQGWCQMVVYLTHLCPFLSVWYVVGFTAERYVIVWHPLRKDRFCTPRTSKLGVGVLSVVGLTLYSFTTWTSGIMIVTGDEPMCIPFPRYYDIITFLSTIDALITLILPSIIIVVLNIRILIRIHQIQKRMASNRRQVALAFSHSNAHKMSTLKAEISDKGSMHFRFSNRSLTDAEVTFLPPIDVAETKRNKRTVAFRGRSQYRLARMLLVASSVFVLLNIPVHYFKIQAFMQHLFGYSYKSSKRDLQWHQFFQLIYYVNFAINFFVYSVCGRPFRSGLKHLVLRLRYNMKHFLCKWKRRYDRSGGLGPRATLRWGFAIRISTILWISTIFFMEYFASSAH